MSGGMREEMRPVNLNEEDTVFIINYWEPPAKTAIK